MLKIKHTLKLSAVAAAIAITSSAYGSAFQLFDQDASQLGNDYAGSVASANSAGTEYYNSAGMTHIKQTQLSFGATAIDTHIAFDGQTSTKTVPVGETQYSPNGVSQGGGLSVVPNFHIVNPLNDRWALGFGLTVPFGLQTDYLDTSSASMAATLTSIRVINVGPSLAYRVNNWLSIGGGIDEQKAVGIFDQSPRVDSVTHSIHNQLSDWALGWHLGTLIDLNNSQRIGLTYRSKVNHKAKGTSNQVGSLDAQGVSDQITTQIILPPTTSVGFYDDLNKQWSIMAKVDYTQWASIKNIEIDSVETGIGPRDINLAQNFRDTYNFAIGANYNFAPFWTWKMGGGIDESPVNNTDRNLRLPDNDHYIVSTGIAYAPNTNFTIDLGYEHIFLPKSSIGNTVERFPAVAGTTVDIGEQGNVTTSADIIGAQLTWKFI